MLTSSSAAFFHRETSDLYLSAAVRFEDSQEPFLYNSYRYKNEVPPWFAVLTGSVAESVNAKVKLLFQITKWRSILRKTMSPPSRLTLPHART